MEELTLEEIFCLLPRLMLQKDSGWFNIKKRRTIFTTYEILKILNLNPEKHSNYLLLEKWSSPTYLFLKKVSEKKPYKYTIEDKTFWKWFFGHEKSMLVIKYLKTKATIIEPTIV